MLRPNQKNLSMDQLIKTHHPIDIPKEMLVSWKATRDKRYSQDLVLGLWRLDIAWATEKFDPIMKELGFDLEITDVWVHFMEKGAFRRPHDHESITGLYYVSIPENSGKMIMEETKTVIIPREGDFYLLPKKKKHSITTHESDEIRWAIAFDCKEKEVL